MTDGLTDVDLRPAFKAVQEDPEGRHSLETSLAPVYEAIRTADARRVDELAHLLDRYLPLAETLVEVDCGPGELLGEQEAVDTFVGVESSPHLLRRAARRVPVVRGDPRFVPAVDVDAVAAFGYLTAEFDRADLRSFVTSALGSLAPGGTLLFDAPLSARAFDADDFEVTDGGVSVRRTVEVDEGGAGETVRVRDRYELVDRLGDETVTTEVVRECRTWDVGTVWDVVHDAGYESAVISSGDVEPGAALVVASSEAEAP